MTVRITTHPATESMVKWMIIFALGAALACVLAQTASGGAPPRTPDTPPATPIPSLEQESEYSPMAWPKEIDWEGDWDRAVTLWAIVDLHKADRHAEAAKTWKGLSLPMHAATWKHTALGIAAMHAHQWKATHTHLDEAAKANPQNPMPHYYHAMAYLREAAMAAEYFDDAGPRTDNLVTVSTQPEYVARPVPRSTLLRLAMTHLQETVKLAPVSDPDRPLLQVAWVSPSAHSLEMPLEVPTVAVLLEAWGASAYEADAHWRLGSLLIHMDQPMEAESHLDFAAHAGMDMRTEYRVLARAFERGGDDLDASRAYLKSMKHGGPYVDPAKGAAKGLLKEMLR